MIWNFKSNYIFVTWEEKTCTFVHPTTSWPHTYRQITILPNTLNVHKRSGDMKLHIYVQSVAFKSTDCFLKQHSRTWWPIPQQTFWNPLRIFQSHFFSKKILSRRKMKEIAPKFQNMFLISWGTHLKFPKFCAGGRHETSHVFAKILFPLWDKSRWILRNIHRIEFFKIS